MSHGADFKPKKVVFSSATAILAGLALTKLVAILFFSSRYGYFRDELYYIACSDYLAFGYVDQPPLSIALLALSRSLFGDSLFALRLLPGIAGAATVFLSALIARKLGAGIFGQALTALAVLFSPVLLGQSRYYSMNVFDILLWTAAVALTLIIIKDDRPGLWPLFGVIVGLGLQNKYSMAFLVIGLVAGLLLTSHRKHLGNISFWAGCLVAGAIFIPHVIWQIQTGFPSVEFMRNASLYKNAPLSPLGFLFGQIFEVGFVQAVLWLSGLAYFFLHRKGKTFRIFGWAYLVIFALLAAARSKAYYLSPFYPVLLAGGAVLVERLTDRPGRRWPRAIAAGGAVLVGAVGVPFVLPVLPLRSFIAYQDFLGIKPPQEERHEMGVLPQHYADMLGWEDMVATYAKVFQSLPPEDRAGCLIYVRNYGQAGAIDFFGPKYGLPKAACGHNSYWLWGPPAWDGKVAIVLGVSRDPGKSLEDLAQGFESVEHAATFTCTLCMPYESNRHIFVCRGLKGSLREIWPGEKNFN